jgi:hypothetical protein
VTHDHDPESAARRALQLLGGELVLTPKLTGDGPLSWSVEYVRRYRLPGYTVEIVGSVSAYGLLACLEELEKRIAEQDAALLAYLKAREEAPRGETHNE